MTIQGNYPNITGFNSFSEAKKKEEIVKYFKSQEATTTGQYLDLINFLDDTQKESYYKHFLVSKTKNITSDYVKNASVNDRQSLQTIVDRFFDKTNLKTLSKNLLKKENVNTIIQPALFPKSGNVTSQQTRKLYLEALGFDDYLEDETSGNFFTGREKINDLTELEKAINQGLGSTAYGDNLKSLLV